MAKVEDLDEDGRNAWLVGWMEACLYEVARAHVNGRPDDLVFQLQLAAHGMRRAGDVGAASKLERAINEGSP